MSNADIVNEWYREHLCGGAVAAHTPAYNQVVTALPVLIERLDAAAAPSEPGSEDQSPEDPAPKGKTRGKTQDPPLDPPAGPA